MCGILGVIGSKVDEVQFTSILARMEHRGPDGFGVWKKEEDGIIFGHRRLSIIDLSDGGKQPFEKGKYVLNFNGEIYNYLELRKELQLKGHQFSTESDTEVLLASYVEWGEECLQKFNGMWAFAIFNREDKTIFFSRDRFGKKPLFYYQENEKFVFGSEMKAITPFLREVKPNLNFQWMVENHFIYEATDKCLVEGIKRFPAGYFGRYSLESKKLTLTKYWDTLDNLVDVPKSYNQQVEEFRELFIDACKIRMRSDVPIGTALSGGLDSSAVICTMAHIENNLKGEKTAKDWQHAYVACFPGSFLDEKPHAVKVVNHLGVDANYLTIDPVEGLDKLSDYLYYFEEIDATSPIPMSKIYNAIKNDGVRVSIDGHGVDEAFSGYGHSIFETFLDTLNPAKIKNTLATYRELHPKGLGTSDSDSDFKLYINYLLKRKKTVGRNLIKGTPLLGNMIKDGPIDTLGNFNYNLYLLFHQSILPTLLRNYERYAMMNSVEIRMPFMDHRLISYAFSLPWESKLKNGYTKYIIRDALQDFMPKDIVWRKQKIGLQTPILEYLKGPWNEYFSDVINSQEFEQSDLVDGQKAKAVLEKINNGSGDYLDAKNLWMLVIPHLWKKSFLDRV